MRKNNSTRRNILRGVGTGVLIGTGIGQIPTVSASSCDSYGEVVTVGEEVNYTRSELKDMNPDTPFPYLENLNVGINTILHEVPESEYNNSDPNYHEFVLTTIGVGMMEKSSIYDGTWYEGYYLSDDHKLDISYTGGGDIGPDFGITDEGFGVGVEREDYVTNSDWIEEGDIDSKTVEDSCGEIESSFEFDASVPVSTGLAIATGIVGLTSFPAAGLFGATSLLLSAATAQGDTNEKGTVYDEGNTLFEGIQKNSVPHGIVMHYAHFNITTPENESTTVKLRERTNFPNPMDLNGVETVLSSAADGYEGETWDPELRINFPGDGTFDAQHYTTPY